MMLIMHVFFYKVKEKVKLKVIEYLYIFLSKCDKANTQTKLNEIAAVIQYTANTLMMHFLILFWLWLYGVRVTISRDQGFHQIYETSGSGSLIIRIICSLLEMFKSNVNAF